MIETLIILCPFAGLAGVHPCLTVVGSQDWTLRSRCDLSSSWLEGRDHIPGDACPNSTQGAVGPLCLKGMLVASVQLSIHQGQAAFQLIVSHPFCTGGWAYSSLHFRTKHFPILNSTRLFFTHCLWCLEVSEDYFLPSQGLAGSFLHCPCGTWGRITAFFWSSGTS